MITSADLAQRVDAQLLRTVACPVCLSALYHSHTGNGRDQLLCAACASVFYVLSGLPILLVDDEHRRLKADEVRGETEYNVKKIPAEVHEQRAIFVDRNTQLFFDEYGIDLADKAILAVGCSMREAEFYAPKTARMVCLDIVPNLVNACHRACSERNISAAWICGDGEYLPLDHEAFDVVIVRQTLHHMLGYYSAISEFFRVCRVGGRILIIDEPFAPLDPQNVAMRCPDTELVYGDVPFGQLRALADIPPPHRSAIARDEQFTDLEKARSYIAPRNGDPESWLADKYHNFSLLNCLYALKLHSDDIYLSWPREVAWTDESGDPVRFCHGPNPHYDAPLTRKLISPGNVSIRALKTRATTHLRHRHGAQAMTLAALRALDPSLEL